MSKTTIPVPDKSQGTYLTRDILSRGLIRLVKAIPTPTPPPSPTYGREWNDAVFLMHPFCWCERDDVCPWCQTCTCPADAHQYQVDGLSVPFADWITRRQADFAAYPTLRNLPEHHPERQAFEQRYTESHDPQCPFCQGTQFPEFGATSGRSAPNFWYKPTNVKIWWYKHIGRSMEITPAISPAAFAHIIQACLALVAHT